MNASSELSSPCVKMESTSDETNICFESLRKFPCIINGKLNLEQFLEATDDLIAIVDRLGKAFLPVKYDMQGNVDKIKNTYEYNKGSCLLELMQDNIANGKLLVAEKILWLNRALLFLEITFQEVIQNIQKDISNIDMKKIFTVAYEGSVKKYHNWLTQQLFAIICKMSPTFPQLMKTFCSLDCDLSEFQTKLTDFYLSLHLVRCKIDDFFKENNLFIDPV